MKKYLLHLALLSLFTFLVTIPARAQAWAGVLPSTRAMDWSTNGATITNRTTQCGATIAAYGTSSSPLPATTINNALASCPAGQFVQLGAGQFWLSTSIIDNASNITIRGMGANQTFLIFTATSTTCNGVNPTSFCVINGDSSAFNNNGTPTVNWLSGYAPGSTALTLSAVVSGLGTLQIGEDVILTQTDDAADTGNALFSQTCCATGAFSQQGGQGVAKANGSQSQNVTVVAINGNVITVTPGIYAPNWISSKNPVAWWSSKQTLVGFGIENLGVDYSHLGETENGIEFHNTRNCWVKDISSVNNTASGGATHKHVNIYTSNHITVRDSYFYGASPTSEGYGVDDGPGSANNLAENNIFQHMPTGSISESGCCSIFGYNYFVDDYYNNGAPNWQQQNGFHHGAGDYYMLWEGNEGIGFNADSIHGTSNWLTLFREYLSGHDPVTVAPSAPNGPKNQSTFAIFPFSYNRYINVIGSVVGTSGYHTIYQTSSSSTTDCGNGTISAASVFVFGYGDQAGVGYSAACGTGLFTIYNDPLVLTTSLRWGNYAACTGDAACNAVRWQTSENASAAPGYPGLANPSQTLPASFYLTSKPAFFGNLPFPGTGPDVTGGNITNGGGHANHTPAGLCYLNKMGGKVDGSSGVLSYDFSICGNAIPTVPTPTIAPAVGSYTSPQTINLTCPSGATCGWTNDGSTPAASNGSITHGTSFTTSTSFSQSIPVTINVIASENGFANSSASTSYSLIAGNSAAINWNTLNQKIDGFGASAPLIGDGNHNLTSAQQSFFFGLGTGQLGLSILRVGLPDGGNAPGSCLTISTGCAGSNVPDMQAAIAQGALIYASPWSPPAAYKTNGSVTCNAGSGSGQLITSDYGLYATWIANFVQSLKNNYNISLYALSIQNEADLCPAYDGALYNSSQIDTFIKSNLGPTLSSAGISTLILTPETSNRSNLSNYGSTCFTDSACYNFVGGVNWHDYDAVANSSGNVTAAPNPWASLGKKYWETESSCGIGYGPSGCETGFTTDMPVDGLMWAGILDDRLVNGNVNAYLYWALLAGTSDNEGLQSTSGTTTKRSYVFGQYAHFIRPGFVRIGATHNPQSGISVSAYSNAATGAIVIVATNYSASNISQGFTISNAPTFSAVTPYVTSPSLSLAAQGNVTVVGNSFSYTLPAQSVTTFVGSGTTNTIAPPTNVQAVAY